MMRALLVFLLLAGCTDDKYLVVTVEARPAVTGASQLSVTLSNAGTSRMDTLPLGSHAFPVTFSVQAPGRSGDLAIKVEAQTSDGIDVGVGNGSATIGDTTASVMLDTADFVVNTDLLGLMGNMQTPLLQFPHMYYFTSSMWDLEYRKTSEKD